MKIHEPENFQTEIVDEIKDKIALGEMTYKEKCFLNGIIRQTQPKKILELGVSAGGSSAVILNAIKDFDNARLYSIDYSEKWHHDKTKQAGFIIDENFAHFKDNWQLYLGGTAARFIEKIGGEIDICLIDTVHSNPGEFLDLLMVLPYLKKNAVIILHDTCYHAWKNDRGGGCRNSYTNGVLFSCIKGKKLTFNENYFHQYANIGAIVLDELQDDKMFDYLYLLTLPWFYLPTDTDILECQNLFKKNYGDEFADKFLKIALYNKELYLEFKKNERRKKGVKNKLIGLIPSRKIRQQLRKE